MGQTYSKLHISLAGENSRSSTESEKTVSGQTDTKTADVSFVRENTLPGVAKLGQSTDRVNSISKTDANAKTAQLFRDLYTTLSAITNGRKPIANTFDQQSKQQVQQENQTNLGMS